MAITITRNDAFIRKTASGLAWITEVQATGAALGTPDTLHGYGRVQKSVYERKATQTKEKDQGGVEIVVSTEVSATMTLDVMQRDAAHITLPTDMDGKYARIIQELTSSKLNGKMQYLVIGCATPEPSLKVDGSNMYPNHVWNCKPVSVAVTVDMTDIEDGSIGAVTGDVDLAVGDYEAIYEYTPA